MKRPTMLYEVAFLSWDNPNPERLGTAEQAIVRVKLWAKDADEAIELTRQVAKKKRMEYIGTASADAITGIILEQIVNDPLNGYDLFDDQQEAAEEPDQAPPPKIELVSR